MNWKRILMGKCSLCYDKHQRWNWFGVDRFWSGRIIYLSFSKFRFEIDCRKNWLEDMVTGVPH